MRVKNVCIHDLESQNKHMKADIKTYKGDIKSIERDLDETVSLERKLKAREEN